MVKTHESGIPDEIDESRLSDRATSLLGVSREFERDLGTASLRAESIEPEGAESETGGSIRTAKGIR